MNGEQRPILVVEDDENDVFFLKYAFEAAGIDQKIQIAEDGQQAIDYLGGKGQFTNRSEFPLPCLILLDLKLPVKMGLDVLRWIRKRPELGELLVIVLTSSEDSEDIDEAYRLGARSYIVKPLSVDDRLKVVKAIKLYWLELNRLPSLCGKQPKS